MEHKDKMIIIDLRPYADKPSTKPLEEILEDHIKQVRGLEKVIYQLPDKIVCTSSQREQIDKVEYKEDNGRLYYSTTFIDIEVVPDEPNPSS